MILKGILIILLISFSLMNTNKRNCFEHEYDYRGRPNLETSILSPSGHFKIHYDKTGEHAATDFYAEEVAKYADHVRNKIVQEMQFLPEIPDENQIYDIYIQDIGPEYGKNLQDYYIDNGETIITSYIKIDNEFENDGDYYTTGLTAMKLTLAHEFFHAVQAAYRTVNADEKYFHEMMAMWIEDIIVPDGNDYIYWVDDGDASNHFFKDPTMSINLSDGYSAALFIHYLSNIFGNQIVREIWEEISIIDNCGPNPIDCGLNSIRNVLQNNYGASFAEIWADFCSKTMFNGDYYTTNDINPYYYEDQRLIIPLTTYFQDEVEIINIGETSYTLEGINTISSKYKIYEFQSSGVVTFLYDNIVSSEFINFVSLKSNLGPTLNIHENNPGLIYVGQGDVLISTYVSLYDDIDLDITINFSDIIDYLPGDCVLDNQINIQDMILMIDYILYRTHFNQLQFENSDINNDNFINIFDVMLVLQLIFS